MLAEKINRIIQEQNQVFIDRATEIRGAWLATLSGQHVFYLGLPGIAKSMLSRDMTGRFLGARYFSKLLRKDTPMAEIFGPLSISALKQDRYKYITTNRLADVHIAFLDEIFKSSSAVLNGLLTAIEEREFENDGVREKIPLMTVYSASNELPQGKDLSALFDRFLLRYEVHSLEDDGDFYRLLREEPEISVNETMTLDELQEAQKKVKEVKVPDDVVAKVVELRGAITSEGLWASDRRWVKGLRIVRANAFIEGRDEATEDDLEIYQHVLWDNLEQKKKSRRAVLGSLNPMNVELLSIMDAVEDAYREFKRTYESGAAKDVLQAQGIEHNANLTGAKERLRDMGKSVQKGSTMHTRIVDAYKLTTRYHKFITSQGLGIGDEEDI